MPLKQAHMVEFEKPGDGPIVPRPGSQSKKQLFRTFFNHAGPLVVDILPQKTTRTSHRYTGTVLAEVVAAVQKMRPRVGTTGTLLLYNIAALRKARATIQYPEGQKLQVLPNPPCRPGLVPWDCWLFLTFRTGFAGEFFCEFKTLEGL